MSVKLYPPTIGGIIPSFSIELGTKTEIGVPFSMNKAVYKDEISGFRLKIKSVITAKEVLSINTYRYNIEQGIAYFDLDIKDTAKLNIGQFYKFQLAYIGKDEEIGYYSTVGVAKCTGMMSAVISGLDIGSSNSHRYSYNGVFNHENDSTEKEYSYRFILFDSLGSIIKDSGEIIHLYEDDIDTAYESQDTYLFSFDLEEDKNYFIQYIITTNNQAIVRSPKYRITKQVFCKMEEPIEIKAEMNDDEGYVKIALVNEKDDIEHYVYGNFTVTRACNDTNFMEWENLMSINISGRGPIYAERKDFTVEQGKYYIYAVQQKNNFGIYSERKLSNKIFADFEDMFLTDGERQLKVRFNPKVTSFKTTILEQKTDTIGSKFPVFFRNGAVNYKELAIGGLISYHSDEEENFMSKDLLGFDSRYKNLHRLVTQSASLVKDIYDLNKVLFDDEYEEFRQQIKPEKLEALKEQYSEKKELYTLLNTYSNASDVVSQEKDKDFLDTYRYESTQLVGYNYKAEREFKLEVLDWLNNGKPKLFRSPGEGNYIVRLMNVSLTPEDTLGRMLHNFTATAYEVADCTYENLLKYNILKIEDLDFHFMLWKTLRFVEPLKVYGEDYNEEWGFYNTPYQDLSGDMPGFGDDTLVYNYSDEGTLLTSKAYTLYFKNMYPGTKVIIGESEDTVQEIVIGATGSYYCTSDVGFTILRVPENNYYQGLVHYSYYGTAKDNFDQIVDRREKYYPCRQFIGEQEIISSINNIKETFLNFYYLKFNLRNIIDVQHTGKYRVRHFYDAPQFTVGYNFNDFIYQLENDNVDYLDQYYLVTEFEDLITDRTIYARVETIDEDGDPYIIYDPQGTDKNSIYNPNLEYFFDDEGNEKIDFQMRIAPDSFDVYEDIFELNGQRFTHLRDYPLPLYRFTTNEFTIGKQRIKLNQNVTVCKDFSNDMYYVFNNEDFNLISQALKKSDFDFNLWLNLYLQEQGYKGMELSFSNFSSIRARVGEDIIEVTKDDIIKKYLLDFYNPTFTLRYTTKEKGEDGKYILSEPFLVDLTGDQNYKIEDQEINIGEINLNTGVYLDCGYKVILVDYGFEKVLDDALLANYKNTLQYYRDILDYKVEELDITTSSLQKRMDACNRILDISFGIDEDVSEEERASLYALAGFTSTDISNDDIVYMYLEYLNAYNLLMNGDIEGFRNLLYLSSSGSLLKEAESTAMQLVDDARRIYPIVYHNYIKRLAYLIKNYVSGGSDYAVDK